MTEPRPPIHPAPGDWPEDAKALLNANEDAAKAEISRLRAELAAAEQILLKQPDWQRHWQYQVSRREEVEATLNGVMLERDHFHAQWQAALRELARKDEALIKCQIVIEQFMTELWEEGRVKCSGLFSVARETLDNINAALEPRKEGGE